MAYKKDLYKWYGGIPPQIYIVREYENDDVTVKTEIWFNSWDAAEHKFDSLTRQKITATLLRETSKSGSPKTLMHNWFPRKHGWKVD